MSMSMIKKRPTVFMPHWDVRLAMLLTKRNYRVRGIASNEHYDLVLFVDGPPVSPIFYGEAKLATMKCDLSRDRDDNNVFRQLKTAMPKVGIGRGAHFLNVMNGGSAWQLVSDHASGPHKTTDLLTNSELTVSSNHHQLMLPNDDADILCVADVARTLATDSYSLERDSLKDAMDVEACFYGHTNSLCFQPDVHAGHEGTIIYLETLMHACLTLGDREQSCEPG